MLVGQTLALMYLDPATLQHGGLAQRETLLQRLADLGFIDAVDEATLRLRPALMRFADPVRDLSDRKEALERLVRSGELVLGDADEEEADDADGSEDDDPEADA